MTNNKGQLLENLFNAIEKRQIAELEEEIANRDLETFKQMNYLAIDRDNEEFLRLIREHSAKEIEMLIARQDADEAYKAYIAVIHEERMEAAAND
jgi:hypothetical protein